MKTPQKRCPATHLAYQCERNQGHNAAHYVNNDTIILMWPLGDTQNVYMLNKYPDEWH